MCYFLVFVIFFMNEHMHVLTISQSNTNTSSRSQSGRVLGITDTWKMKQKTLTELFHNVRNLGNTPPHTHTHM